MELEPGFDYKVLSEKNRSLVQQRTRELKERLQRTAQDIWEIGKKLVEVRTELKGHGYFDAWLKAEFDWSRRTAYNFIYVYEAFPYAKFAQLIIEPSALYRLASPSTPSTIRDKFIQQANAGSKITHKEVLKAVTEERLKQVPNSAVKRSLKSAAAQTEEEVPSQTLTNKEIKSVVPEVQQLPYNTILNQTAPDRTTPTTITSFSDRSYWYTLGQDHLLFCGDTNSPVFFDRLPEAAFALDLSKGGRWQHEWLLYKARTALILHPRERIDGERIRRIVLEFSERENAIILPCAPSGEVIAAINRLKRKLFAGYQDRQQCERAIADSGLKAQKVELP